MARSDAPFRRIELHGVAAQSPGWEGGDSVTSLIQTAGG